MVKIQIYKTPEDAFEKFIQNSKNEFIDRIKQFPNEELPPVEAGIRKLYYETYYLCALSFHNATIILCGVLCEALLKDLIYSKEKKEAHEIQEIGETNATFGNVITFCSKKGYIDSEETVWFRKIKNEIRNLYQHINVKKVVTKTFGGQPFYMAQKIQIPKNASGEELLKILKDAKDNPQFDTLISGEEIRPLYDLEKGRIDEQRSLPLFLEVDKFLRDFTKKHFHRG
ncbi:hypothetical protein HYT57_04845 [Candidatus Woesearchaeota archaeon]|nr:hypothetical protein [Candidatus Woesearchaeota archaeon]